MKNMEESLRSKVAEMLTSNWAQDIIRSNEFYFQKATDALQDFLVFEVNAETENFLRLNKKKYSELKLLFDDTAELSEFGKLLLTIVSYCDSNAHRKKELNQYDDNRVLAFAFVRMNNWVEQLISYKFGEDIPDGSVKNAINYMLNPLDNFTMLSENHRQQISENLFFKAYKNTTFKDSFLEYFDEFRIDVSNLKNKTHLITRIAYFLEKEWKESLVGIMASDSTGWLSNHQMKDSYDVFWNSKRPSGTNKTLKLLRECIDENGHFKLFYTSYYNVNYIAEVIDFVENEKEYEKANWKQNYTNQENCPKYDQLQDDNKVAKITFLIDKFYKVGPIPINQFKIYKSYSYPTQDNLTPIQEYISNARINEIQKMENINTLLQYKKQIILQGPPGTGKTRLAKNIALGMLGLNNVNELQDNEEFKLIQFHPSYTYEDFVRGIVAESKGDKIEYKNVNKTLGLFAEEALKNYRISSQNSIVNNLDIWIDEKFEDFKNEIEKDVEESEINLSGNINLFKVEVDNFRYGKDWASPSRINFSDFKILIKAVLENQLVISLQKIPKELSVHAHYRYTYYNALLKKFFENYSYNGETYSETRKNYVLIIDEINRANLSSVLGELIYALEYRGENVESMYKVGNSNKLILPPNLCIIGTMNTADRSVGHIDYAIRRRFAFVDVLPKNLESELNDDFKDDVFAKVASLFIEDYDSSIDYSDDNVVMKKSEYMTADFDPKDVWLGHSYFIQHYEKNEIGEDIKEKPVDFTFRIRYEIKPILEEYIKDGILKESARSIINSL